MFTEKLMVRSPRAFTPAELLEYMEIILKEAKMAHMNRDGSNYSWLRAKNNEDQKIYELEDFKPIVLKMSSERCVLTAVKLDIATVTAKTPSEILAAIKTILDEQNNAQLLENSVKQAKGKKGRKMNRVHPELLPPGRQPTVSFILD
ncbi:hypothetical protein ACJJTC_005734 [Scirpophaga incertulas]